MQRLLITSSIWGIFALVGLAIRLGRRRPLYASYSDLARCVVTPALMLLAIVPDLVGPIAWMACAASIVVVPSVVRTSFQQAQSGWTLLPVFAARTLFPLIAAVALGLGIYCVERVFTTGPDWKRRALNMGMAVFNFVFFLIVARDIRRAWRKVGNAQR